MYNLEYSTQFKKDFKKITKMPISDIIEVGNIISKLQRNETLDPKNVDHSLTGNWSGFRDCHIKPDLVLIYRIFDGQLQLARIGSHSDLF
ncbi:MULTISPECIES: type II toxin-antitoxin system YafQ family toxin [Aliivibrio]|jgi:mRNA interferase YafQ|uniref:Type II toxin-antitoxin system YafQ family toxin n=1 Tax=Aliivibrio finisterrensis TaxID=511998 RepID=A0A4Q5KDS6_9GAMM|nr:MULTISPECIES: type II toxin-antitoxin system YafQ family toxin [Aliivibrio]OEE11671.1 addiction module toxin RelE [Aliivibrio fischeri ZF-211]RYU44124.1 type II toxin-antitoxin system YafQ family toxin [Aliivibrio finisterrensis]RYU45505.1 type II toxin-antitoxin system YafQ family toxin [Aliivibrio finisterrensis]RYU49309.1 type II toxin-antitoxin system YafQ family toxin [Aliivibrio finisterrensis]RYU57668.1 type II toxin-antitoxin system YafQ family toxin [Aliivibrio finisterrensis]